MLTWPRESLLGRKERNGLPNRTKVSLQQAQTWPFQLHFLGESLKDIAGKAESNRDKYLCLLIKLYMSYLYILLEDGKQEQVTVATVG